MEEVACGKSKPLSYENQILFSVLLYFIVLGKTAKVLWYMNPKAEMEESASGSRSSLCHGVFQHDWRERERETNGIESTKMITWVSVCKKSEKCSAYSEVSTTPMVLDLPNDSCIFGIQITEDRIINTSAAPSVSVRIKGGYSTHSWSFRSGHGIRFAPFKIFGWSIPNTEH
jgi:hypothetical protein